MQTETKINQTKLVPSLYSKGGLISENFHYGSNLTKNTFQTFQVINELELIQFLDVDIIHITFFSIYKISDFSKFILDSSIFSTYLRCPHYV